MQHRNAPLTATGRLRMVELVEAKGLTFEAAATASNVAKSTVHLWVSRWRQASPAQRRSLECLADRPSTPKRSPLKVPAAEERRICELRVRTGWSPVCSLPSSGVEPAPAREWLPVLANVLGAKPPRHFPRWLARLFAGEAAVVMGAESRGASNAKAKRELGCELRHPSWRKASWPPTPQPLRRRYAKLIRSRQRTRCEVLAAHRASMR